MPTEVDRAPELPSSDLPPHLELREVNAWPAAPSLLPRLHGVPGGFADGSYRAGSVFCASTTSPVCLCPPQRRHLPAGQHWASATTEQGRRLSTREKGLSEGASQTQAPAVNSRIRGLSSRLAYRHRVSWGSRIRASASPKVPTRGFRLPHELLGGGIVAHPRRPEARQCLKEDGLAPNGGADRQRRYSRPEADVQPQHREYPGIRAR